MMRLPREYIEQCIMNFANGKGRTNIVVKEADVMPLLDKYGLGDVNKIIDVLLEEVLNPHWGQEDANLASFPPSDYANQDIPYEWLEPYKDKLIHHRFHYPDRTGTLGIGLSGVYNKKEGAFLLQQNIGGTGSGKWTHYYLCWRNKVIFVESTTSPSPVDRFNTSWPREGFAGKRVFSLGGHENPFDGEEKRSGYQLLKDAIESIDGGDRDKKAGKKFLHVFNGFFDDKI
jgi:hypothetical protein